MSSIVIPARSHLRPPVSTSAALPMSGNLLGDLSVAQDTGLLYAWTSGGWIVSAGTPGAPGPEGPPGPTGAAGVGGGVFLPTDLLGQTFWGGPRALTTLVSGDACPLLPDLSGAGHPFWDEGQASQRPTFVGSATPLGRAALQFGGVRSVLVSQVPAGSLITPDEAHIFVVFNPTAVAHDNPVAAQNDMLVADRGEWMGLYLRNTAGTPTLYAVNFSDAEGDYRAVSAPVPLNAWCVAYYRHTGGILSLSVNGGDAVSVASGSTHSLSEVLVYGGTGGLFYDGLGTDLLTYNQPLALDDAASVVSYLRAYNG